MTPNIVPGSIRFLQITTSPDSIKDQESLNTSLNTALDWASFMPGMWILKTRRNPSDWNVVIKQHLEPKSHIFIVEINIRNRQGWLPTWCWDWIKKASPPSSGIFSKILDKKP